MAVEQGSHSLLLQRKGWQHHASSNGSVMSRHRPHRLFANVDGPFYVDDRCINCGTCWQFDPEHFAPADGTAHVCRQPLSGLETDQALLAVQACPVAAIQSGPEHHGHQSRLQFPVLITSHSQGDVFYCGWASKRSFGACSWFIRRPEGNILVDVPRWSAPLARRLKQLGGLSRILLTHRDDVADHQRWASAFGCERWIHDADAGAAPQVEHRIDGIEPVFLDPDLQLIPTPGHTQGSLCVLLGMERQVLFSGDHLWWSRTLGAVVCSDRYCWWDFQEQIRSVKRLLDLDVSWLLPGHGHRHQFPPGVWHQALSDTLGYLSQDQSQE